MPFRTLLNPHCFIINGSIRSSSHDIAVKQSVPTVRRNELGIQMLPQGLRDRIFGSSSESKDEEKIDDAQIKNYPFKNLNKPDLFLQVRKQLHRHGLWDIKSNSPKTLSPDIDSPEISLPSFDGKNIEEHLWNLGRRQSEIYSKLATEICEAKIPVRPKVWSCNPGWTSYHIAENGNFHCKSIDHPSEDVLVFDVETCVKQGNIPVMATALSPTTWYSWCSPILSNPSQYNAKEYMSTTDLIGRGWSSKERLVIGHNISFDRSYIKEQYQMKLDGTRFLDTMSFHVCISGLTGFQRALSTSLRSAQKRGINDVLINEVFRLKGQPNPNAWSELGALNNLVDVYEFYCKGDRGYRKIEKQTRDTFVEGSLEEISANFQKLMTYCSRDVEVTAQVFKKEWPQFLERFPHPVTLSGMLEMSVMYLPTSMKTWKSYISSAQKKYDEIEEELRLSLMKIANKSCQYLHNEKYKKDPWLWDLDWSTQSLKIKNTTELDAVRYRKAVSSGPKLVNIPNIILIDRLYKRQPLLPGYPCWYKDLCDRPFTETKSNGSKPNLKWSPDPYVISTQLRSVPKLMKLMWDGFAVYHDKKHGWGYLVPMKGFNPAESSDDTKSAFPYEEYIKIVDPISFDTSVDQGYVIFEEENLEDSSDQAIEEKKVVSDFPGYVPDVKVRGCRFFKLPHRDGYLQNVGNPLSRDFLRYIEEGRLTSYQKDDAHEALIKSKQCSYWKMSSSRIRSQQVVQISDETDIAAILPRVVVAGTVTRRAVEPTWLTASNAYPDRVGSELKSMIQAPSGYKFVGADVDSQELWIASLIGDSHFAKIHGCTGIGWMTLQGSKSNKTDMHSVTAALVQISRDDAKVLNYGRIYGAGKKFAARFLKLSNPKMSDEEANEKAERIYRETKGKRVKGRFAGGSESHMFNKLEDIARSDEPSTPTLECRVSRALESLDVKNDFMTSLVNWVVQSSAVDFLHLLLVLMKWLFEVYQIDGRFAISIHDEVRYVVAEKDKYRAAYALQLANLLTRSFFSSRLGIHDLPLSVAFFSSVDVDPVLRKEPHMDCKTLSNPLGLEAGHGIPPGESLNIEQIIEKLDNKSRHIY